MKKFYIFILVITLIACSSTSEVVDEQIITPPTTVSSTDTSNTTIENDSSQEETLIEEYVFDNERMSPLTGMEISPELWLKRPRRVLAFKIDNNINLIKVETAGEMFKATQENLPTDVAIFSAAVADFKVKEKKK